MYGPLFAGCDPDLHTFSVAVIERTETLRLKAILLCKVNGSVKEQAVLDLIPEVAEGVECLRRRHFPIMAYAVESQDVSYTGRTNAARKSDLITLAQVAGMAATLLEGCLDTISLSLLVKPQAWKGGVTKWIGQTRTLKRLGIEFDGAGGKDPYPVPRGLEDIIIGDKPNKSDWKDINDSIGLALYAFDRWAAKGGVQ